MNSIETTIPYMKYLEDQIRNKAVELNGDLTKAEMRGIDFEASLTRIEEQIKTAETKFTIAFVGTFKTGKSTIINSLLELSGTERLSSECDPDTAKCVRLMHKEKNQEYETEVVFIDTFETERLSWEDAKKYTSQVALNLADDEFRAKAERIEEVRYYIDNPFLDVCNILDLPGTGTGMYSEHTDITNKKIMEADCVFWVVSTDSEPDRESIYNLEKISTKMLPIINVWQIEKEEVESSFKPEEIKEILFDQFGAYFASAEDPIYYYAGEIDLAQQEKREIKPEWGKSAFTEKVEEILNNIQTGDRMARIKNQISIALSTINECLKEVLEDKTLVSLIKSERKETNEIVRAKNELRKTNDLAYSEIKTQSRKAAQEIIDILYDASDAFIENNMFGMNWKALFKKSEYKDGLKKDFEKNYVKLDKGWLKDIADEYLSSVESIVAGNYSDFAIRLSSVESEGVFIEEDGISAFVDGMGEIISKEMGERIAPVLITAITGGIMMLIPGGLLVEAGITTLISGAKAFSSLPNDSKLIQRMTGVKNASKVQIRQQRAAIVNKLNNEGKRVNDIAYKMVDDKLSDRSDSNRKRKEMLMDIEHKTNGFISFIDEQTREISRM